MKIDVKFFGIAIYKTTADRYHYRNSVTHKKCNWRDENRETIHTKIPKWKCYFVLDLGRSTKSPVLFGQCIIQQRAQ